MTRGMDARGSPFWRFSLAVYGRPEVPPACLTLQEMHGLDVNLLLFACFAGVRGRALTGQDLEILEAAAGPWHTQVVRPLRGARTWMKAQPMDEAERSLRERIKALELEGERIEQDKLWAALPLPDGRPDRTAVQQNLSLLVVDRADLAGGADVEALETLTEASLAAAGRRP
jgi:uncharacterized protein (TIGR02444 family)